MTEVIVCGYGKAWSERMKKYVEFALQIEKETKAGTIIFSGGDTVDGSNNPWLAETEAKMMGFTAKEIIHWKGPKTDIVLEEEAYNTLTNMLYSKQMIDDENEKVIIVCNKAHLPKVVFAAVKVFGLKSTRQRISFCPFSLTTGKIENLKILIKTVPEVIGYFFRPLGRKIEYLQWKLRTGRVEKLNFKQFCSKFRPTGELL